MTTSRYTNPWMNTEIKRAIRRNQRAYRKARLTKKKNKTKTATRNYREREVPFKVRRANRDYLETSVSSDYKENSKKFWTRAKAKKPLESHLSRTRMDSYRVMLWPKPTHWTSGSNQHLLQKTQQPSQTKEVVISQQWHPLKLTGKESTSFWRIWNPIRQPDQMQSPPSFSKLQPQN